MANQGYVLTLSDIRVTLKNLQARRLTLSHRICLQQQRAAARFHSLRVYLQVKQWQGEGSGMSMEDWGWKVTNDQVFPVATDLPPAPESLLQLIRCNCSSDCSSMRCICRKNGMQCSPPLWTMQRIFVHDFFEHCRLRK